MGIFETVVLGAVEGLTEFLPISSTGHLILASKLLNIQSSDFLKSFEISIQLGAILGVVVLYWRRLTTNLKLVSKIIISFIPAGIAGWLVYPWLKNYWLDSLTITLWALAIGGIGLIVFSIWFKPREETGHGLDDISYGQAILIGLAQTIAIIPGVSRSAATIIGGVFTGVKKVAAVEYSFLLAIPTMFAATGYDLYKSAAGFNSSEFGLLALGFIISLVTAVGAMKFLISFVKKHNFSAFGIYRVALAGLWLLLLL